MACNNLIPKVPLVLFHKIILCPKNWSSSPR